ncbi:alpha-L-arabinofuranosidase C-terminal domain-containing protein [Saliterribacillus persicus]|uniref:non-reducing end alpha-L-arabinofuranosidase n=1 Tax=Saliterribacillus persicus TaxID=930114 RepID=A0A368Y116_9BACI|nr:alpha-L-arabinofuranosidase C-terminal domain-containing protein [Saliterribacillus persicus]RCW71944.1 alpha-L-arabinofuranosidase [Saliterribacillus persicus]
MSNQIEVRPNRKLHARDFMIYGHFIEHFHRQIYGGIYEPGHALADRDGFRTDVMEALKRIHVPVMRWPGGCFVSNYHWMDGVGENRIPFFDKAWRVEESNQFGTDEFISYSKKIGAEPYICTNAGSGTAEEMSDWVEYCNLTVDGKWAKKRIENGYANPYNVRFWSIGNENYGDWEMGAKDLKEWGRYVKESAKMMKRVDPNIELFAASIADLDWNINLLREAGKYLDWISIHGYWDTLNEKNDLADFETCMAYTLAIEPEIVKTKHILGALGYLDKIKISFDEWNLRGWHHPNVDSKPEDYLTPRDKNDWNDSYTMADAIFSACFLNQCLKHGDSVKMANFSPTVNTRGMIYTHADGIVLRSTFYVFELYTNYMEDEVIDSWADIDSTFDVWLDGKKITIPAIDMIATRSSKNGQLAISLINRDPDNSHSITLKGTEQKHGKLYSILSDSKDAYNDVKNPDRIKLKEETLEFNGETIRFDIPPHSVHVLKL